MGCDQASCHTGPSCLQAIKQKVKNITFMVYTTRDMTGQAQAPHVKMINKQQVKGITFMVYSIHGTWSGKLTHCVYHTYRYNDLRLPTNINHYTSSVASGQQDM